MAGRDDLIPWPDRVAGTLRRYHEGLVREVAARLVRPRNQWPVEDLIARCLETIDNAVVIDRRLDELNPASRQVLALLGHSRQPTWMLGNVVELAMALGQADGLAPVLDLLEAGLLYPVVDLMPPGEEARGRLATFSHWLGIAGTSGLAVFSPPQIATRAIGTELPLEIDTTDPTTITRFVTGAATADGLEWPLRLAVVWQHVAEAPLRRTQQGGLFKRDVERIEQDAMLNSPPPDSLTPVPDLGFWLLVMAELEGLVKEVDGELRSGTLPAAWEAGLWPTIASLWADLFRVRTWSPRDGWRGGEEVVGNPFPSAYLLTFLLLAKLPGDAWVAPATIESWLHAHHPYWTNESVRPSQQKPWMETFLLGIAYPLRLVEVGKDDAGGSRVRLTAVTRWLLGVGEMPTPPAVFPKTLLVQPNLEVLAYRQGLSPALIAKLTRLASWKTLGAACQLQLEPETVYRALELGESFESLCRTLEQHGTRATPAAVVDALRTWSNKRERITIFPSAALLEFHSPEDLTEALARGLPAIRLGDTLAVVANENQIEFRHFRLAGTRDYALPPERCVEVEDDGVTLSVDLARSDLMLETELPRFAELVSRTSSSGKRQYRLTPASLARGRNEGMTLVTLETWFQQRVGTPITAAARLLLLGGTLPAPVVKRHVVLHVTDEAIADGLMQWPATRELIAERLGPQALSVDESKLAALQQKLEELGVRVG